MKNHETVMYQLTETSKYMMCFVIITKEDNAIIIDGGRPDDMPLLKEYVGGRHISAWFLTHAHDDHISGFVDEIQKNGGADFDIEKVYYNFPPYSLIEDKNVPDYNYYTTELNEMLPAFNSILPAIKDKAHIVHHGERITIDEITVDILYTWHRGLVSNIINDSSIVFKLCTLDTSVLFLGDLGPEGGDMLFRESRHLLKSDMVQMAHHGHMNCGMEVYAEIAPEVCLWCCPDWLYEEPIMPHYLSNDEKQIKMGRHRLYGTGLTRKWMDILGVKKHYVTKDGTNRIVI